MVKKTSGLWILAALMAVPLLAVGWLAFFYTEVGMANEIGEGAQETRLSFVFAPPVYRLREEINPFFILTPDVVEAVQAFQALFDLGDTSACYCRLPGLTRVFDLWGDSRKGLSLFRALQVFLLLCQKRSKVADVPSPCFFVYLRIGLKLLCRALPEQLMHIVPVGRDATDQGFIQ